MTLLSNPQQQAQGRSSMRGQFIFFFVMFAALFVWTLYNRNEALEKQQEIHNQTAIAGVDTARVDTAIASAPVVKEDPFVPVKTTVDSFVTLGSDKGTQWLLNTNNMGIASAKLHTFPLETQNPDTPTVLFMNIAALTPAIGGAQLESVNTVMRDSSTACSTGVYKTPTGTLELEQLIHVGVPDLYAAEITYTLKNTAATPVGNAQLMICSGGLPSQQTLTGEKSYSEYFEISARTTGGDNESVTYNEDAEDFPSAWRGSYMLGGVQNKYIYVGLCADKNDPFSDLYPSRIVQGASDDFSKAVLYVWAQWNTGSLAPGATLTRKLDFYAGPKDFEHMDKVSTEMAETVNISYFSWFEPISRFFLDALVWINSFCGNFGISIIVLTLIVRVLLWPLQHKGTKSMRRMQQIQPKMKELQEKYKDNQQLMSQKLMELYREEGVNPVSGCLPMLIQLPIFIALYGALNGVEMRGEHFLWIADLSKPDYVGSLFGLPIHPLIIAETIIMIVQQYFSPSAAGMQNSQRYMMFLMPLIILFMFYSLPAGLTLYMTVSMIPQIAQDLYIRYTTKPEDKTLQTKKS